MARTTESANEHDAGQDFKSLPAVYQVEATSHCNLRCPMCHRTDGMRRRPQFLDLALLRLMHHRGDFAGTGYVEIQMAGEPTLHPGVLELLRILQRDVGLLVGMSTHGNTIGVVPAALEAACTVDHLTVSVDSVDPAQYERLRRPATLDGLLRSLGVLHDRLARAREAGGPVPHVELQVVRTDVAGPSRGTDDLLLLVKDRGWGDLFDVVSIGDCFREVQGRSPPGSTRRNHDLCLNPFQTVSVTAAGDVVSCCYVFEPSRESVNWYGNLWHQSLADIWAGPRVAEMRRMQQAGESRDYCGSCYLRSPVEIHHAIQARLVQSTRGGGRR